MCASLLGRIARYGVSPLRNAREDRLTAMCAALFDSPHCAGLAHGVALGWLERAAEQAELPNVDVVRTMRDLLADPELSWTCRTQTQLRFDTEDGARRPDLELRFTGNNPDGGAEPVVLLWIEVKHGTSPHTQQLKAYVNGQPKGEGLHDAVLLLAPREQIPTFEPGEIPDEVPRLTWEATAELVKRHRPSNAIGCFLVAELRLYLREEGLMDPEQLTPVHLVALANHHEAVQALEHICHIADEDVIRRWNARTSHDWAPRRGNPSVSWWTYPMHSRESKRLVDAGPWYCEWQYMRSTADQFTDGRPGVPCFVAGMTAEAAARAAVALSETTRKRLKQAGFDIVLAAGSGGYDRVWCRAYPEDVLAGPDLGRQGKALASWIIHAFTTLSTALDESL